MPAARTRILLVALALSRRETDTCPRGSARYLRDNRDSARSVRVAYAQGRREGRPGRRACSPWGVPSSRAQHLDQRPSLRPGPSGARVSEGAHGGLSLAGHSDLHHSLPHSPHTDTDSRPPRRKEPPNKTPIFRVPGPFSAGQPEHSSIPREFDRERIISRRLDSCSWVSSSTCLGVFFYLLHRKGFF